MNSRNEQGLWEKLKGLPAERVAERENFVGFLRTRDTGRQFTRAATKASERAFKQVWDNSGDAARDQLWAIQ